MVTNVTSLTGNGLKDWWIQRATAVYFFIYSLFLLGYLATHPSLTFEVWHQFFLCRMVRIATILAIVAFTLHAWIGLWTVLTDYVQCTRLRFSLQLLVMLFLAWQLIYAFMIVWG